MNKVKINYSNNKSGKLSLTNGSLVVVRKDDKELGAYMVTSFRNDHGKYPSKDVSQLYCSLIDLQTGYIQLESGCPRSISMKELKSKIEDEYRFTYLRNSDIEVDVYRRSEYDIQIDI